MASSSVSNPSWKINFVEEDNVPYPSHNFAVNIVTVKLSGKDVYNVWEEQMICLLKSHDMLGFINGQFPSPFGGKGKAKELYTEEWIRSDSLVKGWILGSLSEKVAITVVDRLTFKHNSADFSAKAAWDELSCMYGPLFMYVPQQTEVWNPSCKIDVVEDEYPYPSHNFADINIVTVKLSGRDVYNVWEEQMLCLLTNHDMLGFIDGRLSPDDGNGKAKEEDMKAWIRSDSLVKGWILSSLSEKVAIVVVNRLASKHKIISTNTFCYKNSYFSAKDAWDELKLIFGPRVPQPPEDGYVTAEDVEEMEIQYQKKILYQLIRRGRTEKVDDKLTELEFTPTDRITSDGNTSLHVAVSAKNQEILEKLLEMIPEEDSDGLHVKNSDGSTPLHVAAIVGNTEAVDVLVQRNRRLLFAKDKKGHTPLAISLYNMHTKISLRLLEHIEKYEENHTMFSGTTGDELLVLAISSKNFSLSQKLVRRYGIIDSEAVLMAIARNFPCELNSFWEWIDQERLQTRKDARDLLYAVFLNVETSNPSQFTNLVFEAIRLNAFEVVNAAVICLQYQILSINEDGLNFIQYAVINRSERIYNLLYSVMRKDQDIYKRIKDPYGNNLLHLAGRLAPANKLNLISGAALRIQRELQWFKEVEQFVGPMAQVQKNYDDETPEMVFTREHVDLVSEGEKWMKTTAESYTITAALIITIVFAAAITVPGGNNQDTGIPIHDNNIAFTMFAVSDAISLFTAVTSLLMFLSILTTRFSAEDFLVKLPRRLIIGLVALFISTTAMIIAFGASLFLVFGHDNSWILIPIGVLTCLPIASFVTLQFPLVADLVGATYGRSIFDKRRVLLQNLY